MTALSSGFIVGLIRQIANERAEWETERESYRLVLQVCLEVLATLDAQVKRIRDENKHLRAQLRSAASGRTIAEERQAIDEAEVITPDAHAHEEKAA